MSLFDMVFGKLPELHRSASPSPKILPSPRSDTVNNPLNLSTVYRAIDILQIAAGQLSLEAIKADGTPQDPQPLWARRPDPDLEQYEFNCSIIALLATDGNAYLKVLRNRKGDFIGVKLLDNSLCVPLYNPNNGARTVQYQGEIYDRNNILHLRKTIIPGQAKGLSPITACRLEIQAAQQLNRYGANFVGNSIPSGILTSEQTFTAAQAEEALERWNARPGGSVAVLGRGLKYEHLLLKPADVQFLESRAFDTNTIARIFGIPPRLMNSTSEGNSMTYANIQDDDISFIRWSVMGYLRAIETAITGVLAGRNRAKYNLEGLLRPSTKTRYETYAIALDKGFMSVDEVREIEGLPTTNNPEKEDGNEEKADTDKPEKEDGDEDAN